VRLSGKFGWNGEESGGRIGDASRCNGYAKDYLMNGSFLAALLISCLALFVAIKQYWAVRALGREGETKDYDLCWKVGHDCHNRGCSKEEALKEFEHIYVRPTAAQRSYFDLGFSGLRKTVLN
jgi:hypothetical protein